MTEVSQAYRTIELEQIPLFSILRHVVNKFNLIIDIFDLGVNFNIGNFWFGLIRLLILILSVLIPLISMIKTILLHSSIVLVTWASILVGSLIN